MRAVAILALLALPGCLEVTKAQTLGISDEEYKRRVDAQPADVQRLIYAGQCRIGMTSEQCLLSWGRPTTVNRSIYASGTHEQWVYRRGSYRSQYLYLENGTLVSMQDS